MARPRKRRQVGIESQATVTITCLTNGHIEFRSNGSGFAEEQADAMLKLVMSIVQRTMSEDFDFSFRDEPKERHERPPQNPHGQQPLPTQSRPTPDRRGVPPQPRAAQAASRFASPRRKRR